MAQGAGRIFIGSLCLPYLNANLIYEIKSSYRIYIYVYISWSMCNAHFSPQQQTNHTHKNADIYWRKGMEAAR